MAQNNILHSAWSEKIAHVVEEELDESARKNNTGRRRSFNNLENESFFNSTQHVSENNLVPNVNLSDDATFPRRTRSTRYITPDELDYDAQNLTLKHTPSSDTLFSRGSRGLARPSPPGSYRSLRGTTVLNTPPPRKENRDGINIIMLIGFAVGIAFGTFFNITEVYLKWLQLKFTEMQLRFYGGKSIQDFYVQEESTAKKLIYSPLSGLFLIIQSIVYVVLIGLDFLKKPAPKTLVSNVMMRYINE